MAPALATSMAPKEFQERTFQFALSAYEFARPMLRTVETKHIAQQLIRASSSVAANHRAAGLARSRKEFAAKIGTVREEADESAFWMLFIYRAGLATGPASERLRRESQDLAACSERLTGRPDDASRESVSAANVRQLGRPEARFRVARTKQAPTSVQAKLRHRCHQYVLRSFDRLYFDR
jgi:four helix bundle protein